MPQLTVSFADQSSRSGPLSFGHANILRSIVVDDDPTRLNLAMVFDAPADGLDRIIDQVRYLVERHESLRTVYRLDPVVSQQVLGHAELQLPVIEAPDDALNRAEEVARRLRATVFDLESELPFRAAVVTTGGVPRHLVWVVSHAAMDVAACELLHVEWTALSNGQALPAAAELEPVDVVDLEHTPSITRLGQSAVTYWAAKLTHVPQAMFTPSFREAPKTDWLRRGLSIRSQSATGWLETIAERTGASASAVALAAITLLVGHRTDHQEVVVTSLSGNRVVRKLRNFFGSLAQDALLPVDLAGLETLDDVVRQIRSAALPAYRHSWFDPTAIWQKITAITGERGISFARDLVFNDMSLLATTVGSPQEAARSRLPSVWIPGHQPAAPDDPELGGSLTWLPAEDIPTRFFACLYRLEGEFEITLWIDPQVMDQADTEEFGRALLRLLRAGAEKELPLSELKNLTTLAPVDRSEGWYRCDRSWIELGAVQALMAEVLGDAPHLVTVVPDDELGHRIVCHLTGPANPEAVHERTLLALPGRVTAMAPHAYVVHAAAPGAEQAGDPQAWAGQPVTVETSGRTRTRNEQ